MMCWGLNQGYTQLAFGVSIHDQWLPPPVPAKYVPGLVEGPAFMGWHPGRPLTHKVGRKTFFDGNHAIQQGHDVGYLIPHIALPPNVMMGINMLTSKHKVMFPVTAIDIEGKPMGTFMFMFLGLICSNPVSIPTGIVIPFAGTVIKKLTLKDILIGLAFIAVDMLIDAIWSLIVKGDKWGNFGFGKAMPPFYRKMLDSIFNKAMTGPLAGRIARCALQKVVDHLGKSWIVSPLFSGTVFQSAQPLIGVPRTSLPSIAIGRAGISVSFFPSFRLSGNVFN